MTRIRGHGWTLLAALAVLAIYAVSLSVLPKHVFWMPDEGANYLELRSVSLHRAGDIRYEVPFPARRIDPGFEFLPPPVIFPPPVVAGDGSTYLPFQTPVLFPLVNRVPLRWFGLTGLYLLPLLSAWGIAIVSGMLMARIDQRWAPFAVLLVGLATPVWFYGMVFWEHSTAGFLALLAVYVVTASPRWRPAAVLAAAAALTAAWILRFEMSALAVAVFLGWGVSSLAARPRPTAPPSSRPASRPLRRVALPLLLAGLTAGLLCVFQASLTLRHRNLLASVPARIETAATGLLQHPAGLVEVLVHSQVSEGAVVGDGLAVAVALALLSCWVAAFARSTRIEAAFVLSGCVVMLGFSLFLLCTAQEYRALHGLFPVAPFLIVWPYALREAWREHRYVPMALANVSLGYLVIGPFAIAMSYLWNGKLDAGMEWGQRLLLVLYPLLAIATLAGLRSYWRSERPRWLRRVFSVAVAAMMVVGVGLEIRGLTMLHTTREALSTWDAALRAEEVIVTDVWWLPSAVAVTYAEREMFFVADRAHTARWIQLAKAAGVRRFTFASLSPVEAGELRTHGVRRAAQRRVEGLYLASFELVESGTPPPSG